MASLLKIGLISPVFLKNEVNLAIAYRVYTLVSMAIEGIFKGNRGNSSKLIRRISRVKIS